MTRRAKEKNHIPRCGLFLFCPGNGNEAVRPPITVTIIIGFPHVTRTELLPCAFVRLRSYPIPLFRGHCHLRTCPVPVVMDLYRRNVRWYCRLQMSDTEAVRPPWLLTNTRRFRRLSDPLHQPSNSLRSPIPRKNRLCVQRTMLQSFPPAALREGLSDTPANPFNSPVSHESERFTEQPPTAFNASRRYCISYLYYT